MQHNRRIPLTHIQENDAEFTIIAHAASSSSPANHQRTGTLPDQVSEGVLGRGRDVLGLERELAVDDVCHLLIVENNSTRDHRSLTPDESST